MYLLDNCLGKMLYLNHYHQNVERCIGVWLPVLIQAVFSQWPLLGTRKLAPKKYKNNFFQDKFDSLKAHAHYFTVLLYLATWRASKRGIFTHFTLKNLPRCSQSIISLLCILYTDPQLVFMSAWSKLWLHYFVLPPPKKTLILFLMKLERPDC